MKIISLIIILCVLFAGCMDTSSKELNNLNVLKDLDRKDEYKTNVVIRCCPACYEFFYCYSADIKISKDGKKYIVVMHQKDGTIHELYRSKIYCEITIEQSETAYQKLKAKFYR